MAQNTVQLIEAAVGQNQFSTPTGAVFDFHAGAQSLGEIVLQQPNIRVQCLLDYRLVLALE